MMNNYKPSPTLCLIAIFLAVALLALSPNSNCLAYVLCNIDWNWMSGSPIILNYKVNGNCVDASAGNAQNQINVIQLAHTTWNNAGADFNFNYNGTHTNTNSSRNGVNEVMWRNQSGGGALATTTIWYVGSSIQECDMVFWDSGITWHGGSSAPPGSMFDIQSVGTHEFGHYLCLDHSPYSSAVMYYAIGAGVMKRELHSDDLAGIYAIYPIPFPPPLHLIASDGFDRQVPISWSPPVSGNPVRYRIYRSTTGSSGNFLMLDSTTAESYTDYGLINGYTYWYKAKAVYSNPTGVSEYSNADDGTPQAQAVIAVSTDTLYFGAVTVNQPMPLNMWIYNRGSLTLQVTNVFINLPSVAPYFDISHTIFSVADDDSFQITVTFTPTQVQSYSCALGISNNSTPPVVVVRIMAQGTLEGVIEPLPGSIPREYILAQNYPNPFNPKTNIDFSIPHYTDVRLTVFDITGRTVAPLTRGKMEAGTYRVTWIAENLPSGIYFYCLEAGSTVLTRKMILLR